MAIATYIYQVAIMFSDSYGHTVWYNPIYMLDAGQVDIPPEIKDPVY